MCVSPRKSIKAVSSRKSEKPEKKEKSSRKSTKVSSRKSVKATKSDKKDSDDKIVSENVSENKKSNRKSVVKARKSVKSNAPRKLKDLLPMRREEDDDEFYMESSITEEDVPEPKKFADNYPVRVHPVKCGDNIKVACPGHWEGYWSFSKTGDKAGSPKVEIFESDIKMFTDFSEEAGGLPHKFILEEDKVDPTVLRIIFTIPKTKKRIAYKVQLNNPINTQ